MKKIAFILSSFLLLTFGSCKKEEIKPNATRSQNNTIEKQQDLRQTDWTLREEGNRQDSPKNNNRRWINTDTQSDSTFVTDPNRDEDEERKVKRK